jgi:hypothetical protein
MDQIPGDVNQSISSLAQNAQTFSPMAGKNTKESTKDGKPRLSFTKKSFGDNTMLSDDMLGDLDPDEDGGDSGDGNSTELKNQMRSWTMDYCDELPTEDEDEDNDFDEDYDEDEQRYDGDDGDDGDDDDEEREERKRREAQTDTDNLKDIDCEQLSEEITGESEGDMLEDSSAEDDLTDREEKSPAPKTGLQAEDDGKKRLSHDKKQEIQSDDASTPEKPEESAKTRTKKSEGFVKTPEEKKDESAESDTSQSFVSLLTQHEGFIIADPKRVPVDSGKPVQKKASGPVIDVRKAQDVDTSIEERYSKVFAELIIAGFKGQAFENLCNRLRSFGIAILEMCHSKGERILLLPSGRTLEDFPQFLSGLDSSYTKVRMGYLPMQKLVVLGEEIMLREDPHFSIPVLYTAFAFDHAMGGENFASEQSPAVRANFKFCREREPGHQFIDHFSSYSPVHYFAQAVESYLTPPRDQLDRDDPRRSAAFCTSEEFYNIDRSMYMYVDYLFKKMRRGNEEDPYQRNFKFKGVV